VGILWSENQKTFSADFVENVNEKKEKTAAAAETLCYSDVSYAVPSTCCFPSRLGVCLPVRVIKRLKTTDEKLV